ncbi:MAG: hypothetical protein ACK4HQ_08575 [Brevinematales bacterium]
MYYDDLPSPILTKATSLIENLFNLVNVMGSEKDVVEGLKYGFRIRHRTLQASMVRVLLKAMVDYAADADANGAVDLRNDAAIKTLMKIRPIVQDNPIPFI